MAKLLNMAIYSYVYVIYLLNMAICSWTYGDFQVTNC